MALNIDLMKQKVKLMVQQIFLSGMQKKQKEFMDNLLKVDSKIQEFMYIISR